jgi:hypothetical protein
VDGYEDGSLDFVFLDDDHRAAHLIAELEAWYPKLAPGGVIAGHDLDWSSVKKAVEVWSLKRGVPLRAASSRCWLGQKPVPMFSWVVQEGQRRCLVAVCCNERAIARQTVESLIKLGWGQRVLSAAQAHGFADVGFTWISKDVLVSALRDRAAMAALEGGYSHVLFLDADMTWPSDVLAKMLAHHGRGIVSGLYHLKTWPHWPVALRDGVWNDIDQTMDYTYDEMAAHADGLRRETLVGMGCTLIPVEVFRRLPRPWFKYQDNASVMPSITEDVWFCQQAATVECPIWLDPTIVCGHVSAEIVNTPHFDRATYEMAMLGNGQRLQKTAPIIPSKVAR